MFASPLVLLLSLLACTPTADDSTPPLVHDRDGDGFYPPDDCDDADALTHPGAAERCDHADNDCNGTIDEGLDHVYTWFPDVDGDGLGNSAQPLVDCDPGPGYTTWRGDCDDADPAYTDNCASCATDLDRCVTGLGEGDGAQYGYQVVAGDFDGDGARDLAISEPGRVYVHHGPLGDDISAAAADAVLVGDADSAGIGSRLVADDFDGDGLDDLLIGDSQGAPGGVDHAGSVSFVSGPEIPAGESTLTGHVVASGTLPWERYATDLTSVGDVDGVPGAEFAIVTNAYNEPTRVEIRSLTALRATLTEVPDSGELDLLPQLAAIDTDGDGLSELYVSAHGERAGEAFRALGFDADAVGELTAADARTVFVGAEGCQGGYDEVHRPGDYDSDGVDDIAIVDACAEGEGWEGGLRIHAFPDGVVTPQQAYALDEDNFPTGMAPTPDLDGDGAHDLLLRDGSWEARLYLGPPVGGELGELLVMFRFSNDDWGDAVASVGDLDGDGDEEVAISPLALSGVSTVYLINGGVGFSDPWAGDHDGDGVPTVDEHAPGMDDFYDWDTDGDGAWDYLDDDDDGDGTPTLDEGHDGDGDPANDDDDGDGTPNYLDADS